jgi:hypothetical protein
MRVTVHMAIAAALSLGACGSDPAGPASPLSPAKTFPLGAWNLLAVGGHGDFVAALDYDGAHQIPGGGVFEGILRVARRTPEDPLALVDLGPLLLGIDVGFGLEGFVITGDRATVVADGKLCVVSLDAPAPQTIATFSTGAGVHAVASGRWLLYSDAGLLHLRDLDDAARGFPELGGWLAGTGTVTGLVPAPDGFLVFTDAGFGHVSTARAPATYAFTASEEVRLFEKAYLHGASVYAGGPSPRDGKVRVAALDVSTPSDPVVVSRADVDGAFADYAWDGAGAHVALLRGATPGDVRAVVVRDSGGVLVAGAASTLPWIDTGPGAVVHARAGLLYAPFTRAGNTSDLAIYALP